MKNIRDLWAYLIAGKTWREVKLYDDSILSIFYNLDDIKGVFNDLSEEQLDDIAAEYDAEDECYNDTYNLFIENEV